MAETLVLMFDPGIVLPFYGTEITTFLPLTLLSGYESLENEVAQQNSPCPGQGSLYSPDSSRGRPTGHRATRIAKS